MRARLAAFVPQSLAGRFGLLLFIALLIGNLAAAFLFARAGTAFDQAIRVQRDMGRLVSLVKSVEESDRATGLAILSRSTTGYTRFSIDSIALADQDSPQLPDVIGQITEVLPLNEVLVVNASPRSVEAGEPGALMLISVRLHHGPRAGEWLNSLVYPLPASTAWPQKWSFFIPLLASMAAVLLVGLLYLRQITRPLDRLSRAARAVGAGDHTLRLPLTGPRELRELARSFNMMQQQISAFEAERQHLLASVGHDLRTPITGLRLRAEMIDDDEQREPMIRTLEEMSVMVGDLTLFARDSLPAEPLQQTDLNALMAEICAGYALPFRAGIPISLTLRPVAMRRAICNLIENALRYAGSAEPVVLRRAETVVIAILDRGPGIAEADLQSITGPFRRGEESRSPETGGYGLGLAIAAGILRSHGGSLSLSNRAGGGLSAELRLPLRRGSQPSP